MLKIFWKSINRSHIFNFGPKRPGRPAKNTRCWKFQRVPPCGSPAAAAEAVYTFFIKSFFFKIPDLVHRPTTAAVVTENHRYRLPKENLTAHYSCQFCVSFYIFLPGSPNMPLDMSKWGLRIMYAGFFLYRAGLVLTRWMLEKDMIVTSLQRGKN